MIEEPGLAAAGRIGPSRRRDAESHVVDPASIAAPRRRRAKPDRIDGEALLRALLAFKRSSR